MSYLLRYCLLLGLRGYLTEWSSVHASSCIDYLRRLSKVILNKCFLSFDDEFEAENGLLTYHLQMDH